MAMIYEVAFSFLISRESYVSLLLSVTIPHRKVLLFMAQKMAGTNHT
jgi:hypothetical protein